MMNFQDMSLEELVEVYEHSKDSGVLTDELIYTFETIQNTFETVKAIATGYSLIKIIFDENENLTLEGFCYQHKKDKASIKEKIKDLEAIAPLYGTKTTFRKLSKKISQLYSTYDFIFWHLTNHGEVGHQWLDSFEAEAREVESAYKSFYENCMRQFKFN